MKKLSPKQAIKEKCKECIYDPIGGNGTWVEQIEGCTSYSCSLYDLRPLSLKTRRKNDENYLASLSPDERTIVENRRKEAGERLLNLESNQ